VSSELLDRRVLGAVSFVDAPTGLPIAAPLQVRAEGARFVRNRRGRYVVFAAPGLETHLEAFEAPPALPARGSVTLELTVSDPGGGYLPRRHTLRLPLDPDPDHAAEPDSLFRAAEVPLLPAPTARTAPGWAVIRASVTATGSAQPLGGALIRVVRTSDAVRLALGMSDHRGEALVAVPGIPTTTFDAGNGPVLATDVEVTVETFFDPDQVGTIPDPTALEANRAGLRSSSTPARLAAGRVLATRLEVPLA
jgi:hypothetical protein